MQGIEAGVPVVVTGSGNVKASQGVLLGFFVNSTTAGTLVFYDDPSTGTTTAISGTITPAAGAFYRFPAAFAKGLNVVVGGTINATLFYV